MVRASRHPKAPTVSILIRGSEVPPTVIGFSAAQTAGFDRCLDADSEGGSCPRAVVPAEAACDSFALEVKLVHTASKKAMPDL